MLWPEGSEVLPVCSWSMFKIVWKIHFPSLKIHPKSEEICGECQVYKNQFKFRKAKEKQMNERTQKRKERLEFD